MRIINKSRLESYVESYLRQRKFRMRVSEVDLLKKARALVEIKLETDCCDPDEPVYDLFTNQENDFTRTVYVLLQSMTRDHNVKSLERTRDLITRAIDGCCDEG